VVVLVVNKLGVFTDERKGQPPILIDPDGEMPFQIALQRVEAPPRTIHISGPEGGIELTQLKPKTLGMLRLNPSLRACPKEPFKSAMAKALDHEVYLYAIHEATVGNCDLGSSAEVAPSH
jgi:hypothetical protein